MMTVLVIDDQKNVVDSICNGLKWEQLLVHQVYGAYNAKEAQKIIMEHTIDIMLSDIEMPEMDGLALLRWVKEQGKDIDCIFLTAHADFSYAKEAIHLGSVEYILQPARFEDIEQVLTNVIRERTDRIRLKNLEKSQELVQENEDILIDKTFEQFLDQGWFKEEDRIADMQKFCHKKYNEEFFYVFGIQITKWVRPKWGNKLVRMVFLNVIRELFEHMSCEILIGGISEEDYVVFIHGDDELISEKEIRDNIDKLHRFIQEKMDFRIAIYINGYVTTGMYDALKFVVTMEQDNVALLDRIYQEFAACTITREDLARLHQERWMELLEENNGEIIEADLQKFFDRHRERLNLQTMKNLHLVFSKALFEIINQKRLSVDSFFTENYSYDSFMHSYYSCNSFLAGVHYALEKLKVESTEKEEDRIVRAKKYIAENINKNLTRTEVAAYVYFNEDYFSRWFSKEMGCSFKDYVMNEKITFAKQLLEHTNLSIAIIASKTGCDNFSYFSKMFRKNVGMTPQEYRNDNRKVD